MVSLFLYKDYYFSHGGIHTFDSSFFASLALIFVYLFMFDTFEIYGVRSVDILWIGIASLLAYPFLAYFVFL